MTRRAFLLGFCAGITVAGASASAILGLHNELVHAPEIKTETRRWYPLGEPAQPVHSLEEALGLSRI